MTISTRKKGQEKGTIRSRRLFCILGGSIAFLIVLAGIMFAIAPAKWGRYRESTYDSVTKSSLNNAVNAQELHFATNTSYKSCVACTSSDLPGYHNDPKVRLNPETENDGYILIATHRDCRRGQWTYQSTTGKFTNPRPFDYCK
jgi:hypothetical protein